MKYKIIGILNLLFGIVEVFIPVTFMVFVIPKIRALYDQSTVDISSYRRQPYIYGGLLIVIGLFSLFTGWKLLTRDKVRYFKFAFAALVLTVLFLGMFMNNAMYSIMKPIYLLTTSTQ